MQFLALGLAILSVGVLSSQEDTMGAVVCTTKSDCPKIPCYTVHACIAEKCQYKQLPAWTPCPKKGCSNGGDCDDDINDYCDAKGVCRDKFKNAGTICNTGASCMKDAKCDGKSGTCPPNKPHIAGHICFGISNGDVCDDQDTCDGIGNCIDKFKRNTVVCQNPTSSDTKTYYCTGSQGSCPVISPIIFEQAESTPIALFATKYFTPDMPTIALFLIASAIMITGVGYLLTQNSRRVSEDEYTAL